jgi:hypothetical protein
MTTAQALPYDWRDKYAGDGIHDVHRRLRAGGYQLRNGEDGGVWLSDARGAVWYPTWQAAYAAAESGSSALDKLRERIGK